MGYGSPSTEHTTAVKELADSRARCLKLLSVVRQNPPATFDTHLVEQPPDDRTRDIVAANQALAEYQMQLHPYRSGSKRWEVDLGTILLPKYVQGEGSKRRGASPGPRLRICRSPGVRISSVSDVISAINMTVSYSSNYEWDAKASPEGIGVRIGGETYYVDESTYQAWQAGDYTTAELIEQSQTPTKEPAFEPAGPPTRKHQGKNFQFVFPADLLLNLLEHTDEIASDMGMLADIELPDYSADASGAV